MAATIPRAACLAAFLVLGIAHSIPAASLSLVWDHGPNAGLAGYLRERELNRLFLCGLAYDFCVRYSAIDGKHVGFETIVIEDATRPVNLPGSIEETNAAFAHNQICRSNTAEIEKQ